jgi:hypothetical protein
MTRAVVNNLFWAAGLILQLSLFVLLFARGIARRMPVFALLLGFYLSRSVALFVLFGHSNVAAYSVVYRSLEVADLLLQFLLTIDIARRVVRAAGGWAQSCGEWLLLLPFLAVAATWLVCQFLPSNARFPADRVQLFDWSGTIFLTVWVICLRAADRPAMSLLRRLSLGLAVYGALGTVATVLRSLAAANRDARGFVEASYILPAAWLATVLYWIVFLKPQMEVPTQCADTPVANA